MCEAHQHHEPKQASAAPVDDQGTTFLVSDMTCDHCAGVVTKALQQTLPGARFNIDLASSRVTVDGDATLAADAIRSAGYSPEPVGQ